MYLGLNITDFGTLTTGTQPTISTGLTACKNLIFVAQTMPVDFWAFLGAGVGLYYSAKRMLSLRREI